MGTSFKAVGDIFFSKVTDDMYLELTPEDTQRDLDSLIINAIPQFEFPRQSLNYSSSESADDPEVLLYSFENVLTPEEINIIATIMLHSWLQRQITSIENTRMKYSGTDFKMTSQANHLSKLMTLHQEIERQSKHLQRLYKRRKIDENGKVKSNWSALLGVSALDN